MSKGKKEPYLPIPQEYSYDPHVITKSISCALSIINKDMRIEWMNKVQEGFFGPLIKLKGQHCYEIYERKNKICQGCPTVKVFKYGLDECVSIRRNIIVNGSRKGDFKLTATPIRDGEGKVVRVLELVEDVTDEVRIQKEVKSKIVLLSRELDFISRLDKDFIYSQEFSLDKILQQAVRIAPALFGAKESNLRLIDGSRKILISRASKGLSKRYTNKAVMQVGEGIAGKVALTRKPIVIKDALVRKDIKFNKEILKEGIRSLICVPILLKDEMLGVLSVYGKKIGTFTKEDCRLLMKFASHTAILIDNIKVHRKVFLAYINTIKSLVSAVEARDAYTRGHSEKVTKFAMDIANSIQLPREDRLMLSYCGRLHDIGKIAIRDSILNKRGPLTHAERAEIQMHPAKGVEILSNLKFLENGIPVIKHHHERYDGEGYPDGLKGKDIPILARIIGCADAYEAMTSDRAYRRRMNAKKAMKELTDNRKKQFDPDILDAFLDILKAKKAA